MTVKLFKGSDLGWPTLDLKPMPSDIRKIVEKVNRQFDKKGGRVAKSEVFEVVAKSKKEADKKMRRFLEERNPNSDIEFSDQPTQQN